MRRSRGTSRFALAHGLLDRDGALDRGNHARELDQRAVAAGAHKPAAVPGDFRIEEFLPVRLEGGKGSAFVLPHKATVAHDVQCEDRSEPALHETISSEKNIPRLWATMGDLSHERGSWLQTRWQPKP